MKPALRRIPWGTANGAAQRRRVYRTDEAIEVDESSGFEVRRRRVLFAEISWVTLHRAGPGPAVWVLAALAALAVVVGLEVGATTVPAYVLFALAALIGLSAAFAATPVWVVTAYGRRSQATVRCRMRESRARHLYGEICRLASAAQEAAVAAQGAAPDPLAGLLAPPVLKAGGEPPPPALEPG